MGENSIATKMNLEETIRKQLVATISKITGEKASLPCNTHQ